VTTFTTEDRIIAEKNGSFTVNMEPIPFAGLVSIQDNQGTQEWLMERLGHVTASRVKDVLAKVKTGEAKTREDYRWELVTQRMTGIVQESYKNSAMEWGTQTEPDARIEYEVRHGNFVTQTGFIKHPTIAWVGASPDGLVDEDGCIEIKCPNTKTHLQTLQSGTAPSQYYGQMQMQMWVTGKQWCDFVSYDPRVTKRNLRFFCIRVDRDNEYIANMEQEVLSFLEEVEAVIFNLSGESEK
jgi:putative phage-type endonuclease